MTHGAGKIDLSCQRRQVHEVDTETNGLGALRRIEEVTARTWIGTNVVTDEGSIEGVGTVRHLK